MRPTIILQNNVLLRRDGDAVQLVVPLSLRHQLFTHTHAGPLAAHLSSQRTLVQYVAFTTGLSCVRTSMPGADNVKGVP